MIRLATWWRDQGVQMHLQELREYENLTKTSTPSVLVPSSDFDKAMKKFEQIVNETTSHKED